MSSRRLLDKVAIVTGGASGIGAATAKLWAREGARVVVVDIRAEDAASASATRRGTVVEEIRQTGGQAVSVTANVASATDVQRMVQTAIDTYGRLDILFQNAGVLGKRQNVTEHTQESTRSSPSISKVPFSEPNTPYRP